MRCIINKNLQLHTCMNSNYTLSLFYYFILISFGYIHEFTLSFFFLYLFIEFLMIYLC